MKKHEMDNVIRSSIVIMLVFIFLLSSLTCNVYAAEPMLQYNFSIMETVGNNYEIIRTYNRLESEEDGVRTISVNYEETKALLLALGMNSYVVNNFTNNELSQLSNCSSITTVTTYIKKSANGIEYITEESAVNEAARINGLKYQNSIKANTPVADNSDQNYYLKVTHTVVYLGEARYKFYTDSEYLSMPVWRGGDSLGSCAMGCTVTPNTQKGYYSYTTEYLFNGLVRAREFSEREITSFGEAINGNWYGSAGIFYLPVDASDLSGNNIRIRDFIAHYEYEGHVHDYETSKWINSIGCHEHTALGLVINPGINIETGGSSASIGLSVAVISDMVSAGVEFQYIPD